MKAIDYFVNLVLSGMMIVGAYQFYFFTQRHPIKQCKFFIFSNADEKIPFMPVWVWIYSFLYYPAILYLNFVISDMREFVMIAFTFICLLFMHMLMFLLLPIETPKHWREINTNKLLSERFLTLIQKFDAPSNCFPSMHVSVSMLTALFANIYLQSSFVFLFPILIALSCIFTKQHYLIDLPTGALFGWLAFQIYQYILI